MDLFFNGKNMAFNVAEDNLHLFTHDSELMNIKKELTVLTYDLQAIVLKNITDFMLNCNNYNHARSLASKDNELELNREYHRLQQQIINGNINDTKEAYLKLYDYQVKLIKILNYKIYKLIEG